MSSTDASSEASSFASENEYLSEYDEMSGIEGLEADISEAEQIETLDDVTAEITAADSPVVSSDDDAYAWVDDPVADEEWTEQYEENMRANEVIKDEMLKRLHGTTELNEWCKCGNCSLEFLSNWQECNCCCELDGCQESLSSEIVQQDLGDEDNIVCITQHPGFRPVCLEKWSLRMAAWTYKTKGKQRYKQLAGEERFLRSVAYRKFTRMVYGVIGKTRIPLPACAYHAIRKKFPLTKDESFTGFEIDEDDEIFE
ncbi:Hypothetical predicted protein [Paramuricea clavata]|uniref:P2X purinoreceptor 7 intracellular domain-containing protein n=1 Tax=Paramuricea clavata TaxID=317549 RepID=A0A6S7G8N8_PARCT|nr:Hypothetical predicted protein [Paramuricea clavata]